MKFGALFLLIIFSTVSLAQVNILGAGATFPYPIYAKWFSEFSKKDKNVSFNYQSLGSGAGVKQVTAGTVDFGASDVPMKAEEMKQSKIEILHVPTVIGGIAVVYNLPEVKATLNLDGELLANIYLGKVFKWSDEKIKKLNPGVNLPNKPIMVARRSDGSGTTAVFTEYLSSVSADWKSQVGAGKAVEWPAGDGSKGNDGVTGVVRANAGSIGYVELAYAIQNKLQVAAVKNKAGKFMLPDVKAISAAAKKSTDYLVSIVNSDDKDAYPISAMTYILLPKSVEKNEKSGQLKKFLFWALTDGQSFAAPMHYAPLPVALAKIAKEKVQKF